MVERELGAAIDELEGITATVTNQDDAEAYRVLYEDIENDQQVWNAISALVLFAAALAAFNLISRIVEAQRREIGIGMALGVDRWRLAIRPLLVGAQIAVLGVIAGVGVGYVVGNAMGDLLESFLPLPEYRTPFQYGVYAQAAALGLIVPIVASAIPVWRAIRVEPIEAIRTGHLTAQVQPDHRLVQPHHPAGFDPDADAPAQRAPHPPPDHAHRGRRRRGHHGPGRRHGHARQLHRHDRPRERGAHPG